MRVFVLSCLLTLFLSGTAFAQAQLEGLGSANHCTWASLTTAGRLMPRTSSTAATDALLIPAGEAHQRPVTFSANGNAKCFYSAREDGKVTVGASGLSVPSGRTTYGPAGVVLHSGPAHAFPIYRNMYAFSEIGQTTTEVYDQLGLCSAEITRNGVTGYPPCGSDSDCSSGVCLNGEGGANDWPSKELWDRAVMFVGCYSAGTSVEVAICIETVPGA